MGRVTVNRTAVRDAYRRNVVPDWQRTVGDHMESAVRAAMPVDTGRMSTELSHEPITHPDGNPGIRLTGKAFYTEWVDQGTGLYGPLNRWITPKRAKALSWMADGKRITRKRVRGQPGQHFFARGLRAVFDRVVTK